MGLDEVIKYFYIIAGAVGSIGATIICLIKVFIISRLNKVEGDIKGLQDSSKELVSKEELKEALTAKIEPLKEDMSEIKGQLSKIYDFLMKSKS